MSASGRPIGVVLFNLGGPGTLEEVEPFLVDLFSDREIIELPFGAALQPWFARLLARVRAPSVRRNYTLIGGGSPQLRITRAQAALLEARLTGAAAGRPAYRVYVAMRYARPSADEALAAMERDGIRQAVTLTLFPHYSRATTGSSQRAFARARVAARAPLRSRGQLHRPVRRRSRLSGRRRRHRTPGARRISAGPAGPSGHPLQRARAAAKVHRRGGPVRGGDRGHASRRARAA